MSEVLSSYLKNQSRNKIVFYKQDVLGLEAIDVGKKLSHEIKSIASDAKIGMKSLIKMNSRLLLAIKAIRKYPFSRIIFGQ